MRLLAPVRLGPPCQRPILIATKDMLFRAQSTKCWHPRMCEYRILFCQTQSSVPLPHPARRSRLSYMGSTRYSEIRDQLKGYRGCRETECNPTPRLETIGRAD